MVHVHQGQFTVSARDNIVLSAVLGSCVSTCLFDPRARIGGMNHFLLPRSAVASDHIRFGANSMELLINGLLKAGARRGDLQAKVFGGAQMAENFGEIGQSNAEFALWFLKQEAIPCVGQSLLGRQARRIMFWPTTGSARQRLIDREIRVEIPSKAPLADRSPDAGDLTLF